METDLRPEQLHLIEEAEVLALLIRETDGSVLAFALYRSVTDREAAVHVLKKRLSLPVVEFTLSVQQQDPFKFIQTLPIDERACVFFYDVEAALPDLAGFLNLQREAFAETPHATVFWIREYGLRELATNAPDFWAWRSGVFDFRSEQVEWSTPIMQTMLDESLVFQEPGDLDRRISLYEGLIEEYSQQEEPNEMFLVGLLIKLAHIYFLRGDNRRAEIRAREALDQVRQLGAREAEIRILIGLGNLTGEDWPFDEAEKLLRSNLSVDTENDRNNNTEIYMQLGRISEVREKMDQAEQWYEKAIALSDQQKLPGIMAQSSLQLGIVLGKQERYAEAEKWLLRAGELYQELGNDSNLAKAYGELGTISEAQGQLNESELRYRKAVEIYDRLGHAFFSARTYKNLGSVALERQQLDKAVDYFTTALSLFEQIEAEDHSIYRSLGLIAMIREQFDEAQEWYLRALDLEERQEQPSAFTHASLGRLYLKENRLEEGIGHLGKAWALLEDKESDAENLLSIVLASFLENLGEKKFSALWRKEVDDEPPIDLLKALLERINQGEIESA